MNCSRCGEPLDALHVVDGCPKRPSDEIIEQATKAMHAEVGRRFDPKGWAHTREARYAGALADAGLLARPLPTREEIADVILAETLFGSRTPIAAADAVLALLKGQDA